MAEPSEKKVAEAIIAEWDSLTDLTTRIEMAIISAKQNLARQMIEAAKQHSYWGGFLNSQVVDALKTVARAEGIEVE